MGASFAVALKRRLREAGCIFVRPGKGDHEIWYSPITDRSVVVDNNTRSRHTVNRILKAAGIDEKF